MIAYVDADDQDHKSSAELLQTHPGPLIVPELVITEVVYMLNSRLGVEHEVLFLRDLVAGNFAVEPVVPLDWQRIADLVVQYRNLRGDGEEERPGQGLGTVDASVVTTAERLGINEVATIDNDFRIVRPRHVEHFTVLP